MTDQIRIPETHSIASLPKWMQDNIQPRQVPGCPVPGECWEWTARLVKGYGAFSENGKQPYVHRRTWTLLVGKIADGLEVDHLCLNKACCNPAHLEPVTHRENMIRYGKNKPFPSRCRNEHELAGANLAITPGGRWRCRECTRTSSRATKERRRRARGAFQRGTGVCQNGHDLKEVGKYGNSCAQCGRDKAARHRERKRLMGGTGQLELVAAI
jgi:hypothetical protein